MNEYQLTFKRYEVKYILSEAEYVILKQKLQDKLIEDKYGKTTICNIYFDTPDYRLIRTSLERPVYKEKLRLRSYGTPNKEDTVFIELKKKYKGVVYKRREGMNLISAEKYLYEGKPSGKTSQIINEIDWFKSLYNNLSPAMYISYDRLALYGVEDKELRITFDSNLLWREEELRLSSGSWGTPILEKGQRLMEIKLPQAMPLWLAHIMTELKLYPVSFSKYGRGYLQAEQIKRNLTKGDKKYA